MKRKYVNVWWIGCLVWLAGAYHLRAQDSGIVVKGTVTSKESGESLPGVSILVKGTQLGTTTDVNGKFSVPVPEKDAILVFSFIGHDTQEVRVDNQTLIDLALSPSSIALEEVVAIGYGTQSRRTITSAITKVSGEVLQNIPITNVGDGLKGKIAGARVYTANNTPGADPVFRIRGGSSINKSNDPLVFVDGVERAFSGINPVDIESIEILKDAASTAIYGSRASNGVVLITTKKGTQNKSPRVTFDANIAFQQAATLIDFMNAEDYIRTVRPIVAEGPNPLHNFLSGYSASSGNTDENSTYTTRYLNSGEAIPAGYKSMADPIDPTKTLIFQDNNFQDYVYRDVAWQNYYVGVDGGSNALRYAASIGYTDDGGVAIGTGFSRITARANISAKISEKLSFNAGFDNSTTTSAEYASQTNVIARGLSVPPTQRVYNSDGTPTKGFNATSVNPLFYDYYNDRSQKNNRTSLIGELTYQITDGLKANMQVSSYNHVFEADYFEKANEFNGLRTTTSSFSSLRRNKLDAYIAYDRSLGSRHSLSAMLGYSYQTSKNKSLSATASGASSDKVPTLTAGPNKVDATSDFTQDVLIGYFGRFNYDYLKKYMFSATFREDASSRFAAGKQWGFFPAMSVGWMVSEEAFIQSIPQVTDLKLRASYGQTGNNSIGLFDAQGRYESNARYAGNAGIIPVAMPNRNLTWEISTQLDIGVELSLFNNRLSINADYFNKITDKLLFSKDLPNTSGFGSVQTNIGKVRFRGFDFELTTINLKKANFSWQSTFTTSFVKNLVLKLPDNGRERNRIGGITLPDGSAFGGTAEGEPLYRYFGYVTEGILDTPEAAAAARYDQSALGWTATDQKSERGRKSAGDYEWRDRDGDGTISGVDQFDLGVTVPHTTGGLNNTFSFKNLKTGIFVDWAIGHNINDVAYSRYFLNTFSNNYTLINEAKKAWKESGDQTRYARLTSEDYNANYARVSNVFNYKGNYLCIREVFIQYDIAPKGLIYKWGVQGMAVTLSASNLHYFTAVRGISPENGAASTYGGTYSYPPTRKYALGVRFTM